MSRIVALSSATMGGSAIAGEVMARLGFQDGLAMGRSDTAIAFQSIDRIALAGGGALLVDDESTGQGLIAAAQGALVLTYVVPGGTTKTITIDKVQFVSMDPKPYLIGAVGQRPTLRYAVNWESIFASGDTALADHVTISA